MKTTILAIDLAGRENKYNAGMLGGCLEIFSMKLTIWKPTRTREITQNEIRQRTLPPSDTRHTHKHTHMCVHTHVIHTHTHIDCIDICIESAYNCFFLRT